MLFVVLLDLRQGLIVLKSSLFSIIWHFVGHGGVNFFFSFFFGGGGGPAGVIACVCVWGAGVMALCVRCDPRVGVSWQLCYNAILGE